MEFGAEEVDNGIAPHAFERFMGEIDVGYPGGAILGKSPGGSGQMDVAVALQVAAKSMEGQIDAWEEVFFSGPLFNDVGGEERKAVEEVTINPEKRLKGSGERPGHMLPKGVG